MIPKIDWSVLVEAVNSVGNAEPLPPALAEDYDKNDDFLRKAHHALFEIEVITGEMECPETGRKFPIQNGVPNMLVNEDEV
jgi:multifunctional methyltransferase subunit TRM112